MGVPIRKKKNGSRSTGEKKQTRQEITACAGVLNEKRVKKGEKIGDGRRAEKGASTKSEHPGGGKRDFIAWRGRVTSREGTSTHNKKRSCPVGASAIKNNAKKGVK